MDILQKIIKISKKYKKKYPEIDLWQFISHGWIGYCNALQLYNDKKCNKDIYLYYKIVFAISESVWIDSEYHKPGLKRKRRTLVCYDDLICGHEPVFDFDFDRKLRLKSLLLELSEKERKIIIDIYYKEKTLKEIGIDLNVDKSRISQIKSEIIKKLRSKMQRAILSLNSANCLNLHN